MGTRTYMKNKRKKESKCSNVSRKEPLRFPPDVFEPVHRRVRGPADRHSKISHCWQVVVVEEDRVRVISIAEAETETVSFGAAVRSGLYPSVCRDQDWD